MAYKKSLSRTGGFTLIELLVAITILAMVAVMGWRGLDSIIRARVALDANMDQLRGLQLVFAQMQSDCSQIAVASEVPGHATVNAENGNLTLLRVVVSDNQPTQFEVVAYRVRDGKLSRSESSATRDMLVLDSMWQAAMGDNTPGKSVDLQSGVELMTMRTYLNGAWGAATTPDPTQPAPVALEVEVGLKGHASNLVRVFLVGES